MLAQGFGSRGLYLPPVSVPKPQQVARLRELQNEDA
jgi:hypothetical protein